MAAPAIGIAFALLWWIPAIVHAAWARAPVVINEVVVLVMIAVVTLQTFGPSLKEDETIAMAVLFTLFALTATSLLVACVARSHKMPRLCDAGIMMAVVLFLMTGGWSFVLLEGVALWWSGYPMGVAPYLPILTYWSTLWVDLCTFERAVRTFFMVAGIIDMMGSLMPFALAVFGEAPDHMPQCLTWDGDMPSKLNAVTTTLYPFDHKLVVCAFVRLCVAYVPRNVPVLVLASITHLSAGVMRLVNVSPPHVISAIVELGQIAFVITWARYIREPKPKQDRPTERSLL
jgi:hypothetical protein